MPELPIDASCPLGPCRVWGEAESHMSMAVSPAETPHGEGIQATPGACRALSETLSTHHTGSQNCEGQS